MVKDTLTEFMFDNCSESRSETSGKVWYVVLEKGGEDHFDRSCVK
jgi:hypothetical protein